MGVFDEVAAEFIGQGQAAPPRLDGARYDPRRVAEAARNWKLCERARKQAEKSIEAGGPLAAEDAVRKQKYVDRLMKKAGVVAATGREHVPPGVQEAIEASASGRLKVGAMPDRALERVIGAAEEFLSVTFVARAAFAMRSVGRIIDRRERYGFGTGFLVAPNVLMTNEHVLETAGRAGAASVQFQYELDMGLRELSGHEFRLEPDRLFLVDPDLDFALVAVADCSEPDACPLTDFGYLPLAGVEGKIHVGQPVNIIQHPDGGRKQIVFRESVLKLLPKTIDTVAHYTGDTKPGSSGSPVFSDSWEVIALHHSGVPDIGADGRWLDLNGEPWDQRDIADVRWVANEGIRVSRLVRRIEEMHAQAAGPARALLGSVLEVGRKAAEDDPFATGSQTARHAIAARETAPVPDPAPQPPAAAATPAAGAVSFQIPLHVTVSLGQPTRG